MAAETLDEAIGLRASLGDDALPVAGGTFIGVLAQTGFIELPDSVIALGACRRRSRGIERDGETLAIGALTTHRRSSASALVRDGWRALAATASASVANVRVRNAGDGRRRARRRRLRLATRRRCCWRSARASMLRLAAAARASSRSTS